MDLKSFLILKPGKEEEIKGSLIRSLQTPVNLSTKEVYETG